VEEGDRLPLAARLELTQVVEGAGIDVILGPGDGVGRSRGEGGDVELAEHGEVVVPDQADLAALAHQLGAAVGLGAVADHVAEAPDLLHLGGVDRAQRGLERGQVGMDVADYGYAHEMRRARRARGGIPRLQGPGQRGDYRRDEWARTSACPGARPRSGSGLSPSPP
jgi:hypothetical protein